jgi:hypothetical protein
VRNRHARTGAMQKKAPPRQGGAKGIESLPPDFDVNAGTTVSFSQLDTWFTMPVAFLNGDVTITPLTTDCHIRLSHTVFRAGGSNASFVANLGSTRRHGKYRRTCQGSCPGSTHGPFASWDSFFILRLIGNAKLKMLFPSSTELRRGNLLGRAASSALCDGIIPAQINVRARSTSAPWLLHRERHRSLTKRPDDILRGRLCKGAKVSAVRPWPDSVSTSLNVLAPSILWGFLALRYCLLIPIEAGWPSSLKRLPVLVMVAPSTLRMDRSWSR